MLSRTGELGQKLKEVSCFAYSTEIRITLVVLWVIINIIIIITSTTSEDDRKRQDTAFLSQIL